MMKKFGDIALLVKFFRDKGYKFFVINKDGSTEETTDTTLLSIKEVDLLISKISLQN